MADEPVPTVAADPRRRGGSARALVAGTAAAVLITGLVAVAVGRGDGGDASPRPLPLLSAAGGDAQARAVADAMLVAPIEYTLAGELPDLGAAAPVWRVRSPMAASEAARRVAGALGLAGDVRERDGAATLTAGEIEVSVYDDGGGLYVSAYRQPDAADRSGGSGGGRTSAPAGPAPDAPVSSDDPLPPVTIEPVPIPIAPPPPPEVPANLPSAAEAERIARDLLAAIGVDGDLTAEVTDSSSYGVAVDCAEGGDCPPVPDPVVLSRSVTLRSTIDGHAVTGLDWYVEVGDGGVVQSVGGTWARLEPVGDYPLRSVADVYGDLASGKGFGDVVAMADGAAGAAEVAPGVTDAPASPEPLPAPEPTRVTVTGAALGAMLVPAFEDGASAGYVVPSYRFAGTFASGDQWSAEVLALDPAFVSPPETTAPVPEPVPGEDPPAEPPVGPGPDPGGGPTVSTPPGEPATVLEPVTPAEDGDLVLYVSNQSFEVDPVDLEVTIDGATALDQEFLVGSQHTWVPFGFDLPDGPHRVLVASTKGDAKAEIEVATAGAKQYLVVEYWAPGRITVRASDTRPAFA